jgi:hypothetical protein
LGKVFKAIATSASSSLLFYCLGCTSGTTGQSATQQQQTATPSITQVTPQTIKAGSQSTTLKITGTNFPTQAAILWNGSAITTKTVDSNTLSGTIGSSSIATPGTVQLKVQNTQTMQESAAVPLVIAPADSGSPLTISLTPLPQGVLNASYSGTLGVTGGTAPYTWSIASGQLPAGLALAPSTGVISGIPSASGNFSFGISVTDSSAQSATATVPLIIGATSGATSTVLTITSTSLPTGAIGSGYSNSLQATGGTAPYTWSFVSGNLPAGLSLSTSTGLISGTPTASGTATFTAAVTDASSPGQTRSVTLSLVIAPSTLAIATSALPPGTQSSSYSRALQATGGTSPYTWSISSGTLPAGLSLASSTGLVSGTPTASGNFSFGVTVQDAGSPAQTASATITLSLVAAGTPLAISSTTLPGGTSNQAYSATLNATGGKAPYTWSIPPNTLPAGLSLNQSTGLISGTPTGTGTSNFTVAVADAESPAQSKSVSLSIAVAAPALTISASLPGGSANTAYSSLMSATGGTPAYTWSISSGSLPAGLTLAATTGIISGTPTVSGTFNFTATVSDNGSPAQSTSAATSLVVAAATTPTGPGNTWYIRPDGGSRYSANQPQGQCDGKADIAYSGTGTNQHCAFNDYRYLWDDRSYGNDAWVIAGGDTVIIRGGPWRVGFNQGQSPNDVWCSGGNGNNACINPTIPAGTPTQHTRILGENYASCSTGNAMSKSSLTQIFGGYGVWMALNLDGAQYVDVECLDITRHSQCIVHGSPQSPGGCSTSYPVDDYDSSGISTDVNTHDLLLQDVWVHGHTDRGIKGPIGGLVTCNRCEISFNGMSGWDFDDGSGSNNGNGTASLPGALWTLNYTSISWNGCNQEYPIVDAIPAISCYSQSTGGYGDGVGTPPGMCLSANINHSSFNYNTQDGLDLGHIDTGSCSLTINDSQAIGNNGQTFKWGPNENPVIFTNNFTLANCLRMSLPMPGAPSTYNAHLSDFCRAGDNLSFNFRQGGTALVANNTVVGYQPTSYDINCWDASCSTSSLIFENNITMGYDNPAMYNSGGQAGGVGGLFFMANIGTVTRANNIFYGMRSTSFNCPTGYPAELCTDPLFANEPTGQGANFTELQLENFNFNLSSGSPAKGAGLSISGVPNLLLDYNGVNRSNPPSIGAVQ